MRLRKLELFGFKSFPEKLTIEVGDGIMAVVGPNGCGKSNVVDAIRWGLGEQSPRMLRGESMGDVIFAGSKTRKPLGMAQVSLTFSNEEGRLPVEYTEVSVGRRVFRSGESEYLINREPCRLRDLKDMFTGTGVGSHSYSLIERAQIDSVITDGTADRRLLLEEAAGITNYKARKKEALRKLEATENDLIRLNDIISEVEREARSLGRQVGKAKRYGRYSERIKELDVGVSRRKYKDLTGEEKGLGEELARRREEEGALQARRGTLDAEAETLRARLLERGRRSSEIERQLREAEGRLADVKEQMSVLSERRRGLTDKAAAADREAQELEVQIRAGEDQRRALESQRTETRRELEEGRAELERRERELQSAEEALEGARSALDEVRRPSVEAVKRVAQLEAEVRRHRSEISQRTADIERRAARREELLSRKDSLEGRLDSGRVELEKLVDGLGKCRAEEESRAVKTESIWEEANKEREKENELAERFAGLESRVKLLRELQESHEAFGEGVMLVMKDEGTRRSARIVGPVAGLLAVPQEMVAAVEGALGEALGHLVSEDMAQTVEVFAEKPSGAGAGVTVVSKGGSPDAPAAEDRDRILADSEVISWLPDACANGDGRGGAAAEYLAGAFLVADERAALRLARQNEDDALVFVTKKGFAVTGGASKLRTGAPSKARGLICRTGEIEACQKELEAVKGALREVRARKAELDKLRVGSLESLEEMRQNVRSLQQACFDKEKEVSTGRTQLESCEEELSLLQDRLQSTRAASDDAAREGEEAGAQLSEAEAERDRCQERLAEAEAHEKELQSRRALFQKAFLEAQGAFSKAEAADHEVESELARLEKRAQELEARGRAKRDEGRQAREISDALSGDLERLEADLRETRAAKERLDESQMQAKEEFSRSELALDEKEKQAREARAQAQEATQKVHGTEIRLAQISTESKGIATRVLAEHGVDLDESSPQEEEEPRGTEEMRGELEELREKLGRLGAVNLRAVEDYKTVRDRRDFLVSQRDDLVQARQELLEAIEKINVTASLLFAETFEKVRENFKRTFSTLFKEGEAELTLEGDDPLEASIEIQARPGGKKLQNIKLLSGGERALTALSLLFAVYLVKPSPFCILDEVDAPLDDANVDKFVEMLREFSARTQFIVVTHNKATMEAADSLYGITMPEPGASKLVSVKFDDLGEIATVEPQEEAVAVN